MLNSRLKAASIGFFDGVHRGHVCLIGQLKHEAGERGMASLLVTFAQHPRSVLSPEATPLLLTTTEEKQALLSETGVDEVVTLSFTHELSRLTAKDFMQEVLVQRMGVGALVLGYDHAFGHGGGTLADYQCWGQEVGIEVIRAHALADMHVSSSRCRNLLLEGCVGDATQLLGRPYSLCGRVVSGFHVGHELGFPTANLSVAPEKLVPAHGAYAVWAMLGDGSRHRAMLNIGNRPTIGNGKTVTVEVNLLDYDGDLYGQSLKVEFVARLREECKFDSRQRLMVQLAQDEAATRQLLTSEV